MDYAFARFLRRLVVMQNTQTLCKIFIGLCLSMTMIHCGHKTNQVGTVTLAEEYIPVCFRELAATAEPTCPDGFSVDIDHQSQNIDYCCEDGTANPGGGGNLSSGGNFCVGADSCPAAYVLSPGIPGPDCELSECAAAGYDAHPFTEECSCACEEIFDPAQAATVIPECPPIPGLTFLSYEPDAGPGKTDACIYQDPDPTITEPLSFPVTCTNGTLQTQVGQDVCVVNTDCPEGTILRPDGMCGTCSDGCITVDHEVSAEPLHVLFLLDRSNSMATPFDSLTKWETARQTISDILFSGTPFEYGLQLFPIPNTGCVANEIAVPIGPSTTGPIVETMTTTGPTGNGTPLVQALATAYSEGFAGISSNAPKAVILLTDGDDSCGANPNQAIQLAGNAYNGDNILTFVISLRALQQVNSFLTTIAEAGGTGRVIRSFTYEDVAEDIQSSLDITACGFTITDNQAANSANIEVTINGQTIPATEWHIVGNQLVVDNDFCDAITSGDIQTVTISSGCN